MEQKVLQLLGRLAKLEAQLGQADVYDDQKALKELTKEHSYLTQIRSIWEDLQKVSKQLQDNRQWLKEETDADFLQALKDDMQLLQKQEEELKVRLENLLVPPDPNDDRNIIIELRAGTGGDEAGLFVGDCVRMYHNYAATKGWRSELLSSAPSEQGGYKEYVMVLCGPSVHRLLQYEAGTHRVQRIPDTETQGRVHTSAITIAILLEPSEEEEIVFDEKELRIDTTRSSGAGGQHVNTTDSAVRITHLPTGIVVFCQEERSQHKNKAKAMRLLHAKVGEKKREEQRLAMASTRSSQVGSGDRSERIRTYNFPQNRVTDHRINLTLYNLDKVMEGVLDPITNPLVAYYHHLKLTANIESEEG